jgi:ATP-dependent Clp endopeptidase proteolytic subunit ClpP
MPKTAHIYIYGDIINEQYTEIEEQGYSSLTTVVNSVKAQAKFDELIVHIHSRGGDVTEGFAIYDYLRSLKKPVTTVIDGLCASIATIIALAGDKRKIQPNSEFYIHNPWGNVSGNYTSVNQYAEELKKAEERILNFYYQHTKGDPDNLRELMDNQTTLSASEALGLGFVTEIVEQERVYAMLNPQQEKTNNKPNMNKALKLAQTIMHKLSGQAPIQASLVLTLDTGEPVFISGNDETPNVGDTLYLGNDETAPIASKGTYTLNDGTVLEADENGSILTVVPVSGDDSIEMKALKESVKSLQTRLKEKETAENTLVKELEGIKAQIQSTYEPKGRQKEVLTRHTPAERNRVSEATERRKEYK